MAAWVKVVKALQASPKKVRLAVDRAEQVAGRLARRGAAAPSPPHDRLTGTDGAIAAWAATLSASMATDGSLFGSLAEGGLGVRQELFRASGYLLTDFGRLPPAEYQAQAETEDAAEAAACAATLAADKGQGCRVQPAGGYRVANL